MHVNYVCEMHVKSVWKECENNKHFDEEMES